MKNKKTFSLIVTIITHVHQCKLSQLTMTAN